MESYGAECPVFFGALDGSPYEIHFVDSVSQSADQSCANLVLAHYWISYQLSRGVEREMTTIVAILTLPCAVPPPSALVQRWQSRLLPPIIA